MQIALLKHQCADFVHACYACCSSLLPSTRKRRPLDLEGEIWCYWFAQKVLPTLRAMQTGLTSLLDDAQASHVLHNAAPSKCHVSG